MKAVTIAVDATGAFPELPLDVAGEIVAFTALPRGTASGRPTFAVIVELADGSKVFGQTSLSNFQMAGAMFFAHYGDVSGHVDVDLEADSEGATLTQRDTDPDPSGH